MLSMTKVSKTWSLRSRRCSANDVGTSSYYTIAAEVGKRVSSNQNELEIRSVTVQGLGDPYSSSPLRRKGHRENDNVQSANSSSTGSSPGVYSGSNPTVGDMQYG